MDNGIQVTAFATAYRHLGDQEGHMKYFGELIDRGSHTTDLY